MPAQPHKTTETALKKTVAYIRCSSLEEGESAKAELGDHAQKLGLEISEAIFDKPYGPPYSLLNLMRSAALERVSSILVQGPECFGSDGITREAIMHLLKLKGAAVISLKKQPAISATERYIIAINDYYSVGGEWEAEFKPQKQSDERPTAGRTVFGYENVDGTIIIKREAAEMIEYVFFAYSQGKTLKEIREALVKTFPADLCPSLSQLYSLVKNKVYAGVQTESKSAYPPIVPMNVWLKCAALNEKRNKDSDADAPLFQFIEYNNGIKLYPYRERNGLRLLVYRSAEQDGVCFRADQIETALINTMDRKLKTVLPVLIEKCIAGARNEYIKYSAKQTSAESDYIERMGSFRRKYDSRHELPYGKALSELERDRAELELEKICLDYLRYKKREFGIQEEHIREYFEHLSVIGQLSRCEQQYFIRSIVRKVKLSDGILRFSLPGFDTLSARVKPPQPDETS